MATDARAKASRLWTWAGVLMGGAFLGAVAWPAKYLLVMGVVFLVGVFVARAALRAQRQAATEDEDR